jgi:hypothetical protein
MALQLKVGQKQPPPLYEFLNLICNYTVGFLGQDLLSTLCNITLASTLGFPSGLFILGSEPNSFAPFWRLNACCAIRPFHLSWFNRPKANNNTSWGVHFIMLIANFLQSSNYRTCFPPRSKHLLRIVISSRPQLTFFPQSDIFRAVHNRWKSQNWTFLIFPVLR